MKIRVIKKDQQTESNWSGGKTRELAIFPEDAVYLDRDFIWRLSTAESDREESSFSKLEGFDRILMVLEGDVVLSHGGERSVHLGEMEQDAFDGGVKTKCFGRLEKDYNLIMAKGCRGSLKVIELTETARSVKELILAGPEIENGDGSEHEADEYLSYGLYCLEGYAVVSSGETSEMVRPGEQLVIDFRSKESVEISVMGEGRCILAEVAFALGEGTPEESPGSKEEGQTEMEPGESRSASFAASYGICMKLFARNNKWSKMLRREGADKIFYDKALSKALSKLERRYVTTLIWAFGCILCFMPAIFMEKVLFSIGIAAVFTIVHFLFIAPFVYYLSLPKPIGEHMKHVDEMNAFERVYHEEEIAKDPHMERVMSKYSSDEDNYFTDENSVLYRLVRKK